MPLFIPEPEAPLARAPTGVSPPNPMRPGELDTVVAAFRQDNPIVSVARRLFDERHEPEIGYNPLDDIRGTPFEERHLDRFIGSRSQSETRSIMRRIDEEEADRKTLDAAGFAGIVAQFGAGMLDPTVALPGGTIVRSARGGFALTRSAASVAAAAGGTTALTELALQATHETRSALESTTSIASATLLGGLIGGGAASLLSRAERNILTRALDRERAAVDAHAGNVEPVRTKPPLPNERIEVVDDMGAGVYRVFSGDAPIAEARIRMDEPDAAHVSRVEVSPENQRAGVATRLYDRIEQDLAERGIELRPDEALTDDAMAFWRQRRPEDVADYVKPEGAAMWRKAADAVSLAPEAPRENMLSRLMADQADEVALRGEGGTRPVSEAAGIPTSAGAAAADARGLELAPSGLGFTSFMSTTRRVFSSASQRARRAMADLAESPYRFVENDKGVATTQGPALDRLARTEINGSRVAVSDGLERLFSEYRFGDVEQNMPRLKARFEDLTGGAADRMSYAEFKNEVSRALIEGDRHSIPQVEQAAQLVRAKVFTPWKERAIAAGLLPEGVETKTAESYFQRVYNKERIRAERPFFVNKVVDWLKADQIEKQGAQQRIESYRGALDVAQDQIKKLEARITTLSDDVEVVEARREEATRVNKFAFQRSTNLRESEFRNDGGVRVAVPGKNIEKARGGAVFETKVRDRGNELADRVSAKLAEIDSLEQKLASEIANHDAMRTKLETEIAAWEGKSVAEAKSAMKARQAAEDERIARAAAKGEPAPTKRLSGADDAIDRAVKRILESDRQLDDETLRARAHEITERILGSPDGRLPYDIPMGGPEIGWRGAGGEPARGSLAAREFNIPDAVIRDFLEQDVETVVALHLRTIVPDVLLTERFGDVRMTEAFKLVEEDYARLTDAATSAKERDRLGKEREAVIRDMAAVRDRVRGVYGWSADLRNMARIAAGAKMINNITSMGVAAISSLPDFAGAGFRWGFANAFKDGWAPYFRYLTGNNEEWGKFKTQMRAVGIGIETATNARQHALDDVADVYRPGSRFERGLQLVNDRFFIANLLAPLTDTQKMIAAHVSVSEILRAAKLASEGKATTRQIGNLAESGIDMQMAGRIWEQFQTGGEVLDGVHLPNTADWRDKAAADALNGAVAREVDIAVVTPGQEKPLWMSHPVLSLLGQFKAFTAAATERVLIANLQRRDAHALSGLMMAVGLGMASYKLNSFFGGQETSKRPQDWVKEGISRGGVLGWFEEGNALASKMTRGGVDVYRMIGADKPLSRFASRSTLDMLLGPTAAKIQGLSKVTGAAAARDWTAADTTALRRLMAFQNLFYVRGMLNQAEGGINGMLNVPERAEPRQPN